MHGTRENAGGRCRACIYLPMHVADGESAHAKQEQIEAALQQHATTAASDSPGGVICVELEPARRRAKPELSSQVVRESLGRVEEDDSGKLVVWLGLVRCGWIVAVRAGGRDVGASEAGSRCRETLV